MNKSMMSLASLLEYHVDAPFDREAVKGRYLIERVAMALYDRHEQFSRWPESVRHFYACYDLNFHGFAKIAYNAPHLIPVAQESFERFGRPIAAELDCTLAQLAIAWCATNPHVSTVITGASRPSQVVENFAAIDVVARVISAGHIFFVI